MDKDIFSSFSLDGKVALITGASRGIGEGIATIYSRAGARLVICSRKQKNIDEASAKIRENRGEILGVMANVSIAEDRERLVKNAMDWANRIDILVNNAGANPSYVGLDKLSESAWDKVFDVNLKAMFLLSQLVYHVWMKDHGGVILNVSSVGGFQSVKGLNAYNVAKAASIHLTKCLASEWGGNGIRVNALAPGIIKTKFSQPLWEGPFGASAVERHPLPRIGKVEDIVGAALLLASDASSFITGHVLVIDGGQLLCY